MPRPRGVITVNGNTERSLRTEEHTAALVAEVQGGLPRPNTSSAIKPPDTAKRVRSTLHDDSSVTPELDQQFCLCLSPNTSAAYVPRVHNYALKIPWAMTEAQDG